MKLLIDRMSPRLMIAVILAVSIVVYFNVLFNGFVIDDIQQVAENHLIKDIRYITEIFSTSVWEFEGRHSNYYRPLIFVIYMVVYYLFGLNAWGFHLINMLFHAANSVLVFLIALRLLRKSQPPAFNPYFLPSFIAAILFAIHPIHTEAIAWIAGIMDASFTFFYLLSFYFYIRSAEDNLLLKGFYPLSVVSFFLATLCKEPALTLPAMLVIYDYIVRKENLLSSLKRLVPYLIATAVYFIMRFNAVEGLAPIKTDIGLSPYQYVINIFVLFSQYLEKLLLPINLNVWHVFRPSTSLFSMKGIISLIVTIIFLCCGFIVLKKNRFIFLCLSFIALPLLPSLYLPALSQGIENAFAERYLYLPSFGFVLLIALLITWVRCSKPKWVPALTVSLTLVIGIYSIGTMRRNTVWRDNLSLWTDAVKKSPDSAIANQNLGYALFTHGRLDEAIAQYKTSLTLNPRIVDAHHNLGVAYASKGWTDKAIEHYMSAIRLRPDFALAHSNLGLAFTEKGWSDKAIEQCQIALRLNPYLADAHNNLGIAYGNMGLIDKAIEHFENAVKLRSDDSVFRINLARAYEIKGLHNKAEEHRRRAKGPGSR